GLRLDLLVPDRRLAEPGSRVGELLDRLREEPLDPQMRPGGAQVGGVDLPGELGALGVDCRIGERGHEIRIGRGTEALEGTGPGADTSLVRLRAREEEGFGLIELVFAMVMLNVGILALVATFQSGALAIGRSASSSNGTAVADKTMEVFRALQNKAIYLNAPTSGGSDVSGYPNGIPNSTSAWYTKYQGDTAAYG